MDFRDSRTAFDEAIAAGRLSADQEATNYAGHYMYMGTQNGIDLFKHIDTRQYLGEQPAPITANVRGLPIYVDRITDGDGITRRLSRPIRLL